MFSVPSTVYVCSNFIGSGNIQDFQVLMFCTVPIIDDIKFESTYLKEESEKWVYKILELYLFCFCVQMKLPVKIFKMVEYSLLSTPVSSLKLHCLQEESWKLCVYRALQGY